MPEPGVAKLDSLDWESIEASLFERGYARAPGLLVAAECREVISLWEKGSFRSHIDMERHRFGVGEYRYFDRPLPPVVGRLRTALYARLAPIVRRWNRALGRPSEFPTTLTGYLKRCHAQGQRRPTPLLLHYVKEGYNCLHQDLYGDESFPLQAAVHLSRPDEDYSGGEFLLVENRPRAQSRGEALRLTQGELLIFPNSDRPARGVRGTVRYALRHGVSRVHSGERWTLGIIFHDAR